LWQRAHASQLFPIPVGDQQVLGAIDPQRGELEPRGEAPHVALGRLAVDHEVEPLLEGERGDVGRSTLFLERLGHVGQAEGDQSFMRGMGEHWGASFWLGGGSRGRAGAFVAVLQDRADRSDGSGLDQDATAAGRVAARLATHYSVAVLPTRPKCRGIRRKSKPESGSHRPTFSGGCAR
jgi:hypothetical protein